MNILYRKLYRLLGLIFPGVYFLTDKQTTLFWLSLTAILFALLEISRFFLPRLNRQIFTCFDAVLKKEEFKKKISGSSYFLLGSLLTVIFFEKPVAIAALVFLVFGDAFSALVGIKWGRIRLGKKSLEGSLAFFLSCLFAALILSRTYLGLDIGTLIWGALAATLIELLSLRINDNLTIPLCSALVMRMVG